MIFWPRAGTLGASFGIGKWCGGLESCERSSVDAPSGVEALESEPNQSGEEARRSGREKRLEKERALLTYGRGGSSALRSAFVVCVVCYEGFTKNTHSLSHSRTQHTQTKGLTRGKKKKKMSSSRSLRR